MSLDQGTINHTVSHISRYQLKPNIDINKIKTFLGPNLKAFIKAHFIEEDEVEVKRIWASTQVTFLEKTAAFAQELNSSLRWKTDNPGCQHFGKFNPIPADPKEWYGGHYKTVIVGLQHDRFQAWMDCRKNIEGITNLPHEIFRSICQYWFEYEVGDTCLYLNKYLL